MVIIDQDRSYLHSAIKLHIIYRHKENISFIFTKILIHLEFDFVFYGFFVCFSLLFTEWLPLLFLIKIWIEIGGRTQNACHWTPIGIVRFIENYHFHSFETNTICLWFTLTNLFYLPVVWPQIYTPTRTHSLRSFNANMHQCFLSIASIRNL